MARRRPRQLSLPSPPSWGGCRAGAGRKPRALRPEKRHVARLAHKARHPVHVDRSRIGQIRKTVAESIAEALSLEELETRRRTKAASPDDVVRDYAGVDLIVDIRTSRWGIHYVPGASVRGEVHFASIYEGSLRLIDARKSAVIAEATCAIQFSNGDDPPTLNELFEDDCALLRKGLTLSAQTCAKRYRTRALRLD